MALLTTPVDDWLDEKRKIDKAEGFWRIHDKLYDFTLWARIHPGGKFWIDITRGTDITEVFESHHFLNETESVLQKYYKKEAASPRNFSTTFHENGFYKSFKRKILQQRLMPSSNGPSFTVRLMSDSLAVAVFLTSLLGVKYGVTWIIVSGALLGVLSASSHAFLHLKESWRMNYFDLSLMSSRDWKVKHVLSHHQYRNTDLDLERQPFSSNLTGISKPLLLMLNLLFSLASAHFQYLQRIFDVVLSKKLRLHRNELIPFALPLFMFFFSGAQPWQVFVSWNLVVLVGSFAFCSLTSFTKLQVRLNSKGEENDFGIIQLTYTGSRSENNESTFSFLNSFRGNVLHYLCPKADWEALRKLTPVFQETVKEFGVEELACTESNFKDVFEGLQDKMPEGHVFFS